MIKRVYIRLFSHILFAACGISFICSCKGTDDLVNEMGFVTLKVVLPDDEEHDLRPIVRSGTQIGSTPAESKFRTLRFLIYDDKDAIEVYKCIEIGDDWTSSNSMWDATNKSLRIPVTVGRKKIYCIANWDVTPTAEMPLINETTAPTVNDLLRMIRVHQNVTPFNPQVMTGFLNENVDAAKQNFKIQLKYQVARVEFRLKISDELSFFGAKVSMTGVKFLNLATHAYLFPQTSLASPASNGVWDQTTFRGDTLALTSKEAEYTTKYYIPEYVNTDESKATAMEVRVDYNGTPAYYKLVLDPSKSKDYPHKAYIIERSHTYLFNLTLFGRGSSTEITRSAGRQTDPGMITYELDINESK